jgi:hypothetical protein
MPRETVPVTAFGERTPPFSTVNVPRNGMAGRSVDRAICNISKRSKNQGRLPEAMLFAGRAAQSN